MKNKKKSLFYIAAGALCLILLLMVLKFVIQNKYTNRLPELPESTTLSEPVIQQIKEATKETKRNPSAKNLGNLGMVYHSSANYQEAATCYKLAIERDPQQWIWSYYLGFLSMEMGQSDEVITNFNRVIEINPEIYHAWYYCGEAHKNLRSYEKAEQYFERITSIKKAKPGGETTRVDHFPLGTYAKFQLSMIYFDSGRMDLAEKTVNEILESNKLFGPAYRLLGNIYRVRGDVATGDKYSLRANDLMIVNAPVDSMIDQLVLLSRSELYVLKKIDEATKAIYSDWALKIIDNALLFLSDNRYLISKAIKTWLWFDFDKKALALADKYLSIPDNTYAELSEIGVLFFRKEHYQQAISYFTKLEVLKPGVLETRKYLASALWFTGEKQKALDVLDQVLESHPHNMEVLADVADLMIFDLGENEIAGDYLKILKHFIPANPKVLKMSAWEAEKDGKINDAIKLYESSFRIDPDDITCITMLGDLLVSQNMWGKSIRLYTEALDHHKNYPLLLESLGTLLITCPDLSLRDISMGLNYSERAFVHSASNPITKIDSGKSLAKAYAMTGEMGKANSMINTTITIARRYAPELLPELEMMSLELRE